MEIGCVDAYLEVDFIVRCDLGGTMGCVKPSEVGVAMLSPLIRRRTMSRHQHERGWYLRFSSDVRL